MYYDPMICKLITWGKDRKEAIDLIAKSLDSYVVRGVTHNIGFGRSILRNNDFLSGHYNTSFIPKHYPTGFRGDPLDADDHHQIALAAHYLRNIYYGYSHFEHKWNPLLYVTIHGENDHDVDYEVK
jgi:propionyl-CoA carboxylase alpha chain